MATMEWKNMYNGSMFSWNFNPETKDCGWKLNMDMVPIRDTEDIEEKVIKLLKGDFEKKHCISIEDFFSIASKIIKDHPEKLI